VSSQARPQVRKNLKNAVFISILAAGLIYLYFKGPRLRSFLNLNILEILLLLAVSFLGFLAVGLSFKSLLRIFNMEIPFKEWFGLTMCNTMFNYYLPARGGTVVKAYYLKKKYGLGYSHYAALMAGSVLLGLVVTSLVGLLIVLFTSVITGRLIVSWAVAFFAFLVGVLLVGSITNQLLRLKIRSKFERVNLFLLNLKDGLTHFSRHKRFAFDFCLFSALFLLVMAVRLYLCFLALNFEVQLWDVLMIMAVTQFSFLISVIPGNLGIKEGIIVFSAGFFGISADQALTAAILDRTVSMVLIFGFGFVYSKILLNKLDDTQEARKGEKAKIPGFFCLYFLGL
jgi:uncharacterized protein (TIRG00374 family)